MAAPKPPRGLIDEGSCAVVSFWLRLECCKIIQLPQQSSLIAAEFPMCPQHICTGTRHRQPAHAELSAACCCFFCCFPKANHDATVGRTAVFCCLFCSFPKANHDATVGFVSRTHRVCTQGGHIRPCSRRGPMWSIFCGTP